MKRLNHKIFFCSLLSIWLVLVISCRSQKNIEKNSLISLQKTACFGKCPVYQVYISKTGKTLYLGERHVSHIGSFSFRLTEKDLKDLKNKFDKISFKTYSPRYVDKTITDLPSIILSYDGKKVIMRGFDTPQTLRKLTQQIENLINDYLIDKN